MNSPLSCSSALFGPLSCLRPVRKKFGVLSNCLRPPNWNPSIQTFWRSLSPAQLYPGRLLVPPWLTTVAWLCLIFSLNTPLFFSSAPEPDLTLFTAAASLTLTDSSDPPFHLFSRPGSCTYTNPYILPPRIDSCPLFCFDSHSTIERRFRNFRL